MRISRGAFSSLFNQKKPFPSCLTVDRFQNKQQIGMATDRFFSLQLPFSYSKQVHNEPVVLLKVGYDQVVLSTIQKGELDLN